MPTVARRYLTPWAVRIKLQQYRNAKSRLEIRISSLQKSIDDVIRRCSHQWEKRVDEAGITYVVCEVCGKTT